MVIGILIHLYLALATKSNENTYCINNQGIIGIIDVLKEYKTLPAPLHAQNTNKQ